MKVVGINGSLRQASWNRMLLRLALSSLQKQGIDASEFDLSPVPIFNADVLAQGMPDSVAALRTAVEGADALVLTTPEYNGTFSAAIKNAIEWMTQPSSIMVGKVFAIMASSPGRLGAAKTHMPLSYAVETEGGIVLHNPKINVPMVHQIFSASGELLDASTGDLVDQTMTALVKAAQS